MKLLKTMAVLALVVGLLLGGVVPAQADTGVTSPQPPLLLKHEGGKGGWAKGEIRVIRGEVTDKGTNEIEVAGETIILDGATKIRIPTLGKAASPGDIQVGMQIVVLAYRAEGDAALHARHIVVVPGRPQFRHHVGQVLEYTDGVSITIQPRQGDPVEFEIADDLKILPPGATVEVGDWVTVISRRDPADDSLIARGVVVHPLAHPVLARLRMMNRLENGLLNCLEWLQFERVSGTITVDEAEGLITVDSTGLNYDDSTIFILRGVVSVQGQSGTVLYKDGLAKVVLVRVEPPEIEED